MTLMSLSSTGQHTAASLFSGPLGLEGAITIEALEALSRKVTVLHKFSIC